MVLVIYRVLNSARIQICWVESNLKSINPTRNSTIGILEESFQSRTRSRRLRIHESSFESSFESTNPASNPSSNPRIQVGIHESKLESTNPSWNPRIQVGIHESKFESTNPASNPRIQVRIHESKFESTNPSSNPRIQVRIHEYGWILESRTPQWGVSDPSRRTRFALETNALKTRVRT